jgi:hypothetical protein
MLGYRTLQVEKALRVTLGCSCAVLQGDLRTSYDLYTRYSTLSAREKGCVHACRHTASSHALR